MFLISFSKPQKLPSVQEIFVTYCDDTFLLIELFVRQQIERLLKFTAIVLFLRQEKIRKEYIVQN